MNMDQSCWMTQRVDRAHGFCFVYDVCVFRRWVGGTKIGVFLPGRGRPGLPYLANFEPGGTKPSLFIEAEAAEQSVPGGGPAQRSSQERSP